MPAKYPPHLYTIELHFGDFIPEFARHFATEDAAGSHIRALMSRMNAAQGQCITKICLYHKNQLRSTYSPTKAAPKIIPLPDPDGIRRYPGFGKYFNHPGNSTQDSEKAKPVSAPLAKHLGLNGTKSATPRPISKI